MSLEVVQQLVAEFVTAPPTRVCSTGGANPTILFYVYSTP
jgi:hypothetical protein